MMPPIISILLPNLELNFFPIYIASNESNAVMIPIITLGYQISTSNIARLNPIARASILVAKDSSTNDMPLVRSCFFSDGYFPTPEKIMKPA